MRNGCHLLSSAVYLLAVHRARYHTLQFCTAGSEGDFCRPVLTSAGPLAITQGRHPLLAALRDPGFEVRANDTFVTPCATLHLLTGPNMSGKSTYLKQVGLTYCVLFCCCGCQHTFVKHLNHIATCTAAVRC
jgi:hypothetical protein